MSPGQSAYALAEIIEIAEGRTLTPDMIARTRIGDLALRVLRGTGEWPVKPKAEPKPEELRPERLALEIEILRDHVRRLYEENRRLRA